MTSIEPLSRSKSLAERTYEQLKDLILSSTLKPGQVVTETWLSEALMVSRTPVRIALSRLMSEGLMTVDGGQVQVRRITVHEARDVSDFRFAIEGHVARTLARTGISADAMDDLQATLNALADLVDGQGQCADTKSFMTINRQFHRRLADETGNALLIDATERVLDLVVLSGLAVLHVPGRARSVVREHAAILSAIAERDEEAAYEAIRIHSRATDRSDLDPLFVPDG